MSSSLPPPPDTTRTPRYRYQVLECIYSADSSYRAVLTRDDRGLIHVSCEKWDLSEWEHCGYAFWSPIGRGETITDTVDNGRKLARERLVELGAAP
jgi:hypothetical protein